MSIRKLRVRLLRLVFVPYVIAPFISRPPWPRGSAMDTVFEWAGYGLMLAGLFLRMWAIFFIGQLKSRELVTEGPYSLTRNPLYIGTFAIAIGAAFAFDNLIMLMIALLVIVPLHVVVAIEEEKRLESLFGIPYDVYRRRVPRFSFSFRSYERPETLCVSTSAIRRAAIDTFVVLLIPPLADLVELLYAHHLLPMLLEFP
ncbi:MAG: hypothetical protein BIFFINMI_00103 [Phycisphaerae bacterium]|nr:hypothetical protein [Phycisphaerae bacterium]